MNPLQRRSFLTLLGGAAASWPVVARAQQDRRVRRIGLLINTVENDRTQQANLNVLREALAKLGWIEGSNLRADLRWGAGDLDRLLQRASNKRLRLWELIKRLRLRSGGPSSRQQTSSASDPGR
jgi:hypothetical protein